MNSLIEPPIPGTFKFKTLEKVDELKRNLAYYEKALARARGVSRCRKFESLMDETLDRCDFSDDSNSDESEGDDGTGENEDNNDNDITEPKKSSVPSVVSKNKMTKKGPPTDPHSYYYAKLLYLELNFTQNNHA